MSRSVVAFAACHTLSVRVDFVDAILCDSSLVQVPTICCNCQKHTHLLEASTQNFYVDDYDFCFCKVDIPAVCTCWIACVNKIRRLQCMRCVLTNQSVAAEQVAGACCTVNVTTRHLLQTLCHARHSAVLTVA